MADDLLQMNLGAEAEVAGEDSGAFDVDKDATLSDRFGVPPFTILDARSGTWQERKRAWLSLGIESELGRGDKLLGFESLTSGEGAKEKYGGFDKLRNTSVFDPVVCELAYRWFTAPGSRILDPFAGGSVRGLVAAKLGRYYYGVDLRKEQVEANVQQGRDIAPPAFQPIWIEGDSLDVLPGLLGMKAEDRPASSKGHWAPSVPAQGLRPPYDFVFSCPPYFDLEKYSKDERDLSNAGDYAKFLVAYREIIKLSVACLKDNAFAAFIVGDIRNKKGNYYGFVADTIKAFEEAGAPLYNDGILVSPVGTLAVRTSGQFGPSRKMGKAHQNFLVFLKGDHKKAVASCGEITVDDKFVWA